MDSLRFKLGTDIITNMGYRAFYISWTTRLEKLFGFTYTEKCAQDWPELGCLRLKSTCESAANFFQEKLNI